MKKNIITSDDSDSDVSKNEEDCVLIVEKVENNDKQDKKEKKCEKLNESCSDEQWFQTLKEDEKTYLLDNLMPPIILEDMDFICTTCMEPMSHLKAGRVQRHPLLGVPVCRKCKNFYFSGEWTQGDDGTYDHCRWCANGGDLLLCDHCPNAFCKKCIKRNLGRKKVTEIEEKEDWLCIACDPKQIYKQRAAYYSVNHYFQNSSQREEQKRIEKEELKKAQFVDHSFQDALQCCNMMQQNLKSAKGKWDKKKTQQSEAELKKAVKKIRKVFRVTSYNMSLLENSLIDEVSKVFPKISVDDLEPETEEIPVIVKSEIKGESLKEDSKDSDLTIENHEIMKDSQDSEDELNDKKEEEILNDTKSVGKSNEKERKKSSKSHKNSDVKKAKAVKEVVDVESDSDQGKEMDEIQDTASVNQEEHVTSDKEKSKEPETTVDVQSDLEEEPEAEKNIDNSDLSEEDEVIKKKDEQSEEDSVKSKEELGKRNSENESNEKKKKQNSNSNKKAVKRTKEEVEDDTDPDSDSKEAKESKQRQSKIKETKSKDAVVIVPGDAEKVADLRDNTSDEEVVNNKEKSKTKEKNGKHTKIDDKDNKVTRISDTDSDNNPDKHNEDSDNNVDKENEDSDNSKKKEVGKEKDTDTDDDKPNIKSKKLEDKSLNGSKVDSDLRDEEESVAKDKTVKDNCDTSKSSSEAGDQSDDCAKPKKKSEDSQNNAHPKDETVESDDNELRVECNDKSSDNDGESAKEVVESKSDNCKKKSKVSKSKKIKSKKENTDRDKQNEEAKKEVLASSSSEGDAPVLILEDNDESIPKKKLKKKKELDRMRRSSGHTKTISSSDEDEDNLKKAGTTTVPVLDGHKRKRVPTSESSGQEFISPRKEDITFRECKVDINAFSSKLMDVLEQKGKVDVNVLREETLPEGKEITRLEDTISRHNMFVSASSLLSIKLHHSWCLHSRA